MKVKKGQKVVRVNAIGQVGCLCSYVCRTLCTCSSSSSSSILSAVDSWGGHELVNLAAGALILLKAPKHPLSHSSTEPRQAHYIWQGIRVQAIMLATILSTNTACLLLMGSVELTR